MGWVWVKRVGSGGGVWWELDIVMVDEVLMTFSMRVVSKGYFPAFLCQGFAIPP